MKHGTLFVIKNYLERENAMRPYKYGFFSSRVEMYTKKSRILNDA